MPSRAIALFQGKIHGEIEFYSQNNSKTTRITIRLSGFAAHSTHAIHIHEYGDTRKGCESLGGHFNPQSLQHGSYLLDGNNRHAGDLMNNIRANSKGEVKLVYRDPLVKLRGKNSVYGRSVVIHQGVDNLGKGKNRESKITGNAGGRIACAIIAHTK